jgi:hypothetical protein
VPEDDGAYDRGVVAGELAQRLAGHDQHLARINGSMDRVADRLETLVSAVQRLSDATAADRATVITTAAALKDADEARRATEIRHWTPFQRGIAVIGAVGVIATIIYYALGGHT